MEESDDLTAESFMSARRQKVLRWSVKDSERQLDTRTTYVSSAETIGIIGITPNVLSPGQEREARCSPIGNAYVVDPACSPPSSGPARCVTRPGPNLEGHFFGFAFPFTKATLRATWLYPVTVKML